jgi:alkyl hydroperoxide reductase subunit AhpC
LYSEFKDKGLLVLGVALESRETKRDVSDYSKKNIQFPVVWDAQNTKAASYQVRGIPAAFLLDKDNKVVWQGNPRSLTSAKVKELLGKAR